MRYVIKQVQAREAWMHKASGQEMKTYAIQLEGHDGWVKLNQRATSNPPQAGDAVDGEVNNFNGVSVFKKEFKNPNAPAADPSIKEALERIEQKIDGLREALNGLSSVQAVGDTPEDHVLSDEEESVIDDFNAKPVSLEEIPF